MIIILSCCGPDAPNEWLGISAAPISRSIDCRDSHNRLVWRAIARWSRPPIGQTCRHGQAASAGRSVLLILSPPMGPRVERDPTEGNRSRQGQGFDTPTDGDRINENRDEEMTLSSGLVRRSDGYLSYGEQSMYRHRRNAPRFSNNRCRLFLRPTEEPGRDIWPRRIRLQFHWVPAGVNPNLHKIAMTHLCVDLKSSGLAPCSSKSLGHLSRDWQEELSPITGRLMTRQSAGMVALAPGAGLPESCKVRIGELAATD